jgi:uncharacterized protein (DUF362 family)
MPVVSLVRSKSTDESRIAEMVHQVLEPLGGIEAFVSSHERVLLKPNFVTNRKYFTGATTDPLIILAMIRELKRIGVEDITVADSSWTGCSTERVFNATGITGICRHEGVKLVDLKKDEYEWVKVQKGEELGGKVEVARTVLDSDKLINLPKLKAHCQALVTLSLKNLKGCITDDEKRRFHRLDLDRCIAELNTVLKPDLIVLDGIIAEMTAELGCDPIRLDTIVAGTDPVAVDSVCSTMLGYEPIDIPHIVHAEGLGCGTGIDLDTVELKGDVELSEITGKISGPVGFQRYEESFAEFGIDIKAEGACSSCLAALYIALKRISDSDELEKMKGTGIYLGQNIVPTYTHLMSDQTGKQHKQQIGVGKCSLELEGMDVRIKGCPPSALGIFKKLKTP